MDNLTLAGQINYKKITDGEPIYQEFQKMSKEPMKYNTDLLMKILSDNKDTEYGKKYHFADIHSIEEFQTAQGIEVNGIVDRTTWNRLAEEYNALVAYSE